MRWVICILVCLGFAPRAFAQDFNVLRGTESVGPALFTNWTGFYVGGQYGYGAASGDFSNATSSIIAQALRITTVEDEFTPSAWPVLGTATDHTSMFGGFIGYNSQWQNLILGVEGNYVQTRFSLVAPSSPIGRITPTDSGGVSWTVIFDGTGSATNVDYGVLRGRAGVVLGNFLPYGFLGFALGKADINVSSVGSAEGNAPVSGPCSSANTPPCYLVTWNVSDSHATLLYGAAVGAGLDVAITQHLFLRGEFEYLRFAPVSDIVLSAITARLGVAFKF